MRVKEKPWDIKRFFPTSIDSVTSDRAADKSQVYTDLVCSAREGLHLEQGVAAEFLKRVIFCDSVFALISIYDSHPLSVFFIPPNCGFDPAARCRRLAVNQRDW